MFAFQGILVTIHMPDLGEASHCCFLTNLLETTLDDLESPLLYLGSRKWREEIRWLCLRRGLND
ncbi:hypothetical protein YC2023_099293 [Brassica napus]